MRAEEFAKDATTSLAMLYDPDIMPMNLRKAHKALDKAVDTAYGQPKFSNEAERVAFLFGLYEQYLEAEKVEQEGRLIKSKKTKVKTEMVTT